LLPLYDTFDHFSNTLVRITPAYVDSESRL
jgi:hypothetical protein